MVNGALRTENWEDVCLSWNLTVDSEKIEQYESGTAAHEWRDTRQLRQDYRCRRQTQIN